MRQGRVNPARLEHYTTMLKRGLSNKKTLIERALSTALIEKEEGRPTKITAMVAKADEVNKNGRLYPLAILEREVSRLQDIIRNGQLLGHLDHPQNDGTTNRLSEAALRWIDLSMNGPAVWGTAEVLGTAAGRDLAALLHAGIAVEVSSRGIGSVVSENRDGQRVNVVAPDYRLITFDIVADASTPGTKVAIAESTAGARPRQLTVVQQWMRELAGLSKMSEGYTTGPDVVHSHREEAPDDTHRPNEPARAAPDFRTRLAEAIKAKTDRVVIAVDEMGTASDPTAWTVFEPATTSFLQVRCSETPADAIQILSLASLNPESVCDAVAAYRRQVFETTLVESRQVIAKLAGVPLAEACTPQEGGDECPALEWKLRERMQRLAGIRLES
jgi:hypothetical protein